MKYRYLIIMMTSALLLCQFEFAKAELQKCSILLKSESVSGFSSSDTTLGDYYVLKIDIPQAVHINDVIKASMEIYVDVSSVEKNGYENRTPVLEMYELRSPFLGEIDENQFIRPSRTARNIMLGDGIKVKFDMTEYVKRLVQEDFDNHGLILGSLSGLRAGRFIVRNDILSDNAMAKITIYYYKN